MIGCGTEAGGQKKSGSEAGERQERERQSEAAEDMCGTEAIEMAML